MRNTFTKIIVANATVIVHQIFLINIIKSSLPYKNMIVRYNTIVINFFCGIIVLIFFNLCINFSKSKLKQVTNKNNKFLDIYTKEEIELEKAKEMTTNCLKIYKSPEKRRGECFKYRKSLPSYNKIPYKEIYRYYKGGFNAIIEPPYQYDIDIIVGVPFAPPLIDGRIVARRTYMKDKTIDGYKAAYFFFTGLIPDRIYRYNYSLLIEESKLFNDILVFDMVNTYWNITLLLLSMHKWILEKYPKIKYFIRCNLDAVFVPRRIKNILNHNYDVISQIGMHVKLKIFYPQGFFYIFSLRIVKYIYEMSFKKRLHRWDDIFYGEIITTNQSIKVYDLKNQSDFICIFCNLLYTQSFISLHSYTFSPAVIEMIYLFTLYNVNFYI